MISFLTPLGAPDIEDDQAFEDIPLSNVDYSDKPLVRNISEFKFWQYNTNAIIVSCIFSMFEVFDIPVFWPFLLFYFFFLVLMTFRKLLAYRDKLGYKFFE